MSIPQCQCTQEEAKAGCLRFGGRSMNQRMWQLCQRRADYRRLWDKLFGRVNDASDIKLSHSLPELIRNFRKERKKWLNAGRPLRTQKQMHTIFEDICSKCDYFEPTGKDKGKCQRCGCRLSKDGIMLNKIAWATTQCPDDPPKWLEESPEFIREESKKYKGPVSTCGGCS